MGSLQILSGKHKEGGLSRRRSRSVLEAGGEVGVKVGTGAGSEVEARTGEEGRVGEDAVVEVLAKRAKN